MLRGNKSQLNCFINNIGACELWSNTHSNVFFGVNCWFVLERQAW
jgi:hypothetical protein